ncbi:cysteine proteinase [Aulographum hederae CBS 113979]|uniref:Cysteine proteinase n=1 Tax=Aulographum hederae CBS 113979 TaxID=1176131 RepID=A0A6G1H4V5_9PEZI|nr:cysteine proteinase [Aulographum hederae CBS 113979]
MAPTSTTLAAMQAEATELGSRVNNAPSKDEALGLAIQAAQLCMKALKLATSPEQKSELKSKCQLLLNQAEEIKTTPTWRPLPQLSSLSLDTHGTSVSGTSGSPSIPASNVRKLVEPVSTRDLSKKEQLLVLRASMLNDFKFKPWKGPPDPSEFAAARPSAKPFRDNHDLILSPHQMESFDGWKHAVDALPPPTLFPGDRRLLGPMMHTNRSIDLVQDAAADCSVVASLCAGTARVGKGHQKLLGDILFPYDTKKSRPMLSQNGKYIAKLYFNGCYRQVEIDDRLPVSKTQRMLHVFDRKNPALLWPALIEKAYLKVRGGYVFPGSNPSTDLLILTGWIPEHVFLQDDSTGPQALWKRIFNAFQYGDVFVTMGTGHMSSRVERELGLAGQHAYAVLDMKEEDDQKLFLLKNPWCEGTSWRGSLPRSSSSRVNSPGPNVEFRSEDGTSTPSSMLGVFPRPQEQYAPGIFWIDLNSVLQHFESIYLNWNPGLFTHRQDIHFAWNLTDQEKRGSPGCFINHPQFALTCKAGGPVWLLLCRHFQSTTQVTDDLVQLQETMKSDLAGHISIYVYDRNGQHVYISEGFLERGPYVDSPQTLLRIDVPANTTYTVVISEQDLASTSHTFTLSAFASATLDLSPARDKYLYQSSVKSSWTSTTAGGNATVPSYHTNPQFSLTVPIRTSLVLLLETLSPDLHVHVKLIHGRGQRVASIKRRDILLESGDYRRMSAIAEIDNVEPGVYTIICSTFEAGQIADFTLRIDSIIQTAIKQLPPEYAGRLPLKLSDAFFNPSCKKVAAPLHPSRMVRLMVIAKFIRAPAAPGTPVELGSRSPLRVSIELGRGPDRRFLMTSSHGEYSDAEAGVRTEDVDLWPAYLQEGEMWLVLDRLAGPATGEERCRVELFCDGVLGDDLKVGVWRDWDD